MILKIDVHNLSANTCAQRIIYRESPILGFFQHKNKKMTELSTFVTASTIELSTFVTVSTIELSTFVTVSTNSIRFYPAFY